MHCYRERKGLPNKVEEIIQRVEKGFVPILSAVEGFISFRYIDAGDGVIATISVFQTADAAEESNKAAANWVKENLAEFNPTPPHPKIATLSPGLTLAVFNTEPIPAVTPHPKRAAVSRSTSSTWNPLSIQAEA